MANFFSLPFEVKDTIYAMAFKDICLRKLIAPSYQNSFRAPNILFASREHHDELKAAVVSHSTIQVSMPRQIVDLPQPHLIQNLKFFLPLKPEHLHQIKSALVPLEGLKNVTISMQSRVDSLPHPEKLGALATSTEVEDQETYRSLATIVESSIPPAHLAKGWDWTEHNLWINNMVEDEANATEAKKYKMMLEVTQNFKLYLWGSLEPRVGNRYNVLGRPV
jgi:hypothetical protein